MTIRDWLAHRRQLVTKANYTARAGETITGNLKRGGDGRFTSGGGDTSKKPKTGAELAYNNARSATRSSLEDKAPKPKKGKGGGGKKAKPKISPEEKKAQAETKRTAEQEKNFKSVATAANLNELAQTSLNELAGGNQPSGDGSGLVDIGIAEKALDGSYRLTSSGRRFLAAAKRGDLGAAKDALSLGQDRNTKIAERRDTATKRKAEVEQRKVDRAAKLQSKRDAAKKGKGRGRSKSKPAETPPVTGQATAADDTSAAKQKIANDTATQVKLPLEQLADMQALADGKITGRPEYSDSLAQLGFYDANGLTQSGYKALSAIESGNVRAYIATLNNNKREAQRLATKSHIVIKQDKDGKWRWVMTSTTAFEDQDRETVTKAAIRADVDHADKTGEYGPLLWWHTKYRLGTCDFNMQYGPLLIESGTFRNVFIAKAVARNSHNLGVSIGFLPLPWEQDGPVYNFIRRKERSILPRTVASNLFTRLTVHKEKSRMDDETKLKIKQLAGMLGLSEEDALQMVQKEAARVAIEAAALGLKEKAANPFPPKKDDPAGEVMEKADPGQGNPPEPGDNGEYDEEDDLGEEMGDEEADNLFSPEELNEIASAIGPVVAQAVIEGLAPILDMEGRIMKLIDNLKGIAVPPAPVTNNPGTPMVTKGADDKLAAMELKLKEATDKIDQLNGDQPAGTFHRPSWGGDTFMGSALAELVRTKSAQAAGKSANRDALDDVVDAILPQSKATS